MLFVGERMSNKILKGTLLLTGASFISKFLGMIYVIPFNAFVGSYGVELYYYAYNPYTILLGVSTVGIPMAVSKVVSKYNSLGYYDVGLRVLRSSMVLMSITGLLSFLFLFFSSEWLAARFIYSEEYGSNLADVKKVMQMVSFALLIIPSMSVLRGFFQGNQRMEPTAISQVVEQIVRIAFILISAYIIVRLFHGNVVTAVSLATFAAFIGALASALVLFTFWQKTKAKRAEKIKTQQDTLNVTTKELLIELISYAGPFVLVGITIPLYQAVDTFLFNKAMVIGGYGDISGLSLAVINFNAHKLIIIPVTLATGLSLTIVPALTASYIKQDYTTLKKQINQALQIVILLVVPAVVGLSSLAYEAYGSLYGMENLDLTSNLLAWYAPVALFFALYTVAAAVLQGINEQRFALISLVVGFIVKLSLNSVMIHHFAGVGSILTTGIAVMVAVILNLWRIHYVLGFSYKQTAKRSLFVVIFSLVMWGAIILTKLLVGLVLPLETSRNANIIMLAIGIIVGGIVYLFLAYKSTLLDHVLGDKNILNRFRRKNRASR